MTYHNVVFIGNRINTRNLCSYWQYRHGKLEPYPYPDLLHDLADGDIVNIRPAEEVEFEEAVAYDSQQEKHTV